MGRGASVGRKTKRGGDFRHGGGTGEMSGKVVMLKQLKGVNPFYYFQFVDTALEVDRKVPKHPKINICIVSVVWLI